MSRIPSEVLSVGGPTKPSGEVTVEGSSLMADKTHRHRTGGCIPPRSRTCYHVAPARPNTTTLSRFSRASLRLARLTDQEAAVNHLRRIRSPGATPGEALARNLSGNVQVSGWVVYDLVA